MNLRDFVDKNGDWFEIRIVSESTSRVKIHYIGFPPLFDEEVVTSVFKTRSVKHLTHVPDWRSKLQPNSHVDVYIVEIHRWERLRVSSISNDRNSIKHREHMDWLNIYDDHVSKCGSRTPNRSGTLKKCSFPNGVQNAMSIAQKYFNRNESKIGAQIYEELASFRLLPKDTCLDLFHKFEDGQIHKFTDIESRRMCDAKAASMMEAAFSTGNEADARLVAQEEVESDDSEVEDTDANLFDNSILGGNAFLRYNENFRLALQECWATLLIDVRQLLNIADLLEAIAMKTNSVVHRRTLFSEAAWLIQKARDMTGGNRKLCHEVWSQCDWRIARHYINGLGIDITDCKLQDAADIQASEYINLSKKNRYLSYLLAVLLSMGRSYAAASTDTPLTCLAIEQLFRVAIEGGVMPAAYWYAKLLFEGWGDQSTRAARNLALTEANRLFELCEGLSFNVLHSQKLKTKTSKLILAAHAASKDPWYLLSLNVYKAMLKSKVVSEFPSIAIQLVKQYASASRASDAAATTPLLCDPTGSADSVTADWVTDLRDRVLFASTFQADTLSANEASKGGGNGKGGSHGIGEVLAMWLRQVFNNTFYREGTRKWTLDDAKSFIQPKLLSAVNDCRAVCDEFEGIEDPVVAARTRLDKATMRQTDSGTVWNDAVAFAKAIYDNIDPMHRTLKEQEAFFENIYEVMKSENVTQTMEKVTGRPGKLAVIRVVKLARELAKDSREAEPDVVNKHCRSAEAIITYCSRSGCTIPQAIQNLDVMARPLITGVLACEFPARLGYHTIVDAINVKEFLEKQERGDSTLTQSRCRFLAQDSSFNSNWRGPGKDKSLLAIFEFTRRMVSQKQQVLEQQTPVQGTQLPPVLNLEALTHADPWATLLHCDLDLSLRDYLVDLAQLQMTCNLPEEELAEQILGGHVNEKFRQLNVDPTITHKLNASARLQLKKKMLFLLDNAPDMDWSRQECLALLGLRLNEGLRGRCPDGISSFCDDFIQQITFARNSGVLEDISSDVSRLILSISSLVYQMKSFFIKMNLSRDKAHYEARTVGPLVLNYMLLLPLSLRGDYGQIMYPRFATQGYTSDLDMASEAVVTRFIDGGEVAFIYGETVTFPELTVAYLAKTVKSVIVKSETGEDQEARRMHDELQPNLEPAPRLYYTINEDVIKAFCRCDVIISPHYFEAQSHDFSFENLFFKKLLSADEEGHPTNEELTKPLIVQVMKDAVFVRILEVSLYVKVPDGFWANLSKNFSLI